jgi:hypothetical protein
VPKFVADSVETTGLKWVAPAGGGKVLQLVNSTYATLTGSTTTTYIDSGITATITPSLSSSKVLIAITGVAYVPSNNTPIDFRLLRDATLLATWTGAVSSSTGGTVIAPFAFDYYDSPATTSATTYKLQFRNQVPSGTVYVQISSNPSNITVSEIGA